MPGPDIRRRDRPDRLRQPVRAGRPAGELRAAGRAVVFRTAANGPLDEDLRTGIDGADYKVAFEIDSINLATQQGWSVLIQGPAHHVIGTEQDAVRRAGVEPRPRDRGSCSSGSSRLVSPAPRRVCLRATARMPARSRHPGFAISTGYPRLAPLAGTGRGSSVCLSLSVAAVVACRHAVVTGEMVSVSGGGRRRRGGGENRKIEPRPATAPRPKAAREMMKAPGQTSGDVCPASFGHSSLWHRGRAACTRDMDQGLRRWNW